MARKPLRGQAAHNAPTRCYVLQYVLHYVASVTGRAIAAMDTAVEADRPPLCFKPQESLEGSWIFLKQSEGPQLPLHVMNAAFRNRN